MDPTDTRIGILESSRDKSSSCRSPSACDHTIVNTHNIAPIWHSNANFQGFIPDIKLLCTNRRFDLDLGIDAVAKLASSLDTEMDMRGSQAFATIRRLTTAATPYLSP